MTEHNPTTGFAEQLVSQKGLELVIDVAHDLRTPLTSILFLAESLRAGMSGALTPLQQHQIGLIYAAAFGLASVANDLTELAHGGVKLLERRPVSFSVASMLQSVHDIVRPIAEDRGIEIRIEHTVSDRRVGHPAALGRVLLNLVTNALTFTSTGFVATSATARSDESVVFSVQDSGEGIPPDLVATLFDGVPCPSHTTCGRGYASSGLGLAICRRLVSMMGGELGVRSAPGQGTCFSFELDLPVAAEATNAA
jgi:two-component system sensor histidine kinase/response regulator